MSTELAAGVESAAEAEPVPAWLIPPPDGFTAGDLDRLPDLPPHTELLYGSLVFVSPQSFFHMYAVDHFVHRLRALVPRSRRVPREMSLTLGPKHRPEPDLMVISTEAMTRLRQTTCLPESVVLVGEVVSPESVYRDRELKPQLYAEAGIPHFWRVENEAEKPVVYVYELDPATRAYTLTGIHRDRLKLSVPFDIDIDLTDVDPEG